VETSKCFFLHLPNRVQKRAVSLAPIPYPPCNLFLELRVSSRLWSVSKKQTQEDRFELRSKLPGSINSKAKTQTDQFSIRRERAARPRTEPRYEISLGKDPIDGKKQCSSWRESMLRSSRMGRCIYIFVRSGIPRAEIPACIDFYTCFLGSIGRDWLCVGL